MNFKELKVGDTFTEDGMLHEVVAVEEKDNGQRTYRFKILN